LYAQSVVADISLFCGKLTKKNRAVKVMEIVVLVEAKSAALLHPVVPLLSQQVLLQMLSPTLSQVRFNP
jgi:ribosomal protein S26